jgi:peptidoglycan/xylan/chitin deacetylase (PgdA/CDA1 family)
MHGFRSKVMVLLVAAGLLAGCAEAGTAPMAGSRWESGATVPGSPSPEPEPTRQSKPAPTKPAPTKPAPAKPVPAKPVPAKPASSNLKPAKPEPANTGPRFGGPAGSMTRTGGAGVALTFDDGPDPVQTPRMLDLLAKYHVRATFCLVGTNVQAYPALVRRIVADGHTLCNHSWQHSLTLGKQSPAVIRADLQKTNDAIHDAVPGAKVAYLRAPGGNFTPAYVRVAAEMGMKSIYWQTDPRDWDHPIGESSSAHRARVIAAVQKQVRKGSIVLSHDCGQPDTIAAYRVLIPWLQARYRLVPLKTQ